MMRTTTGGSHDVIERWKVPDEEFFGRLRLLKTPAIRHRLAAASLVKGVDDIHFQLFQKLQSGDTDFRIENIDVTGDHQGNLHRCSLSEARLSKLRLYPGKCLLRRSTTRR